MFSRIGKRKFRTNTFFAIFILFNTDLMFKTFISTRLQQTLHLTVIQTKKTSNA